MPWKNIVNLDKLEFVAEGTDEHYHYAYAPSALSKELGARQLGFNVSELPPKQFSCPYHFHHSEEELFLVLNGRAILRQAGEFREVSKGDLIVFPTGPEGAHQFYNHTSEPFRYLALSTLDPNDVAEYPDSKKINIRRLKKIFQGETAVEYMRGEKEPREYWPKERL